MRITVPFRTPPKERLGVGASQGLVYGLDSDIVLKLPFQYEVIPDVNLAHCWDLSVRSSVAMKQELAVYTALQREPHPNFPRRFAVNEPDCLFLERLQPLQEAWPHSSCEDRQRWVLEFLEALCWLESLGFIHGDLAVRNIGIDKTNHLKLFDFGSALSVAQLNSRDEMQKDHFDAATCLHYLLTGVDPLEDIHSASQDKKTRALLETGQWNVVGEEDATTISHIIQGGWTGTIGTPSFRALFDDVAAILLHHGWCCRGTTSLVQTQDETLLESRCQDWLRHAERDRFWRDWTVYIGLCGEQEHVVGFWEES